MTISYGFFQKCHNTEGGYVCSCIDGYFYEDLGSCKANSSFPSAKLLFPGKHSINVVNLDSKIPVSLKIVEDEERIYQPIGIGYDFVKKRVYWTDVARKMILSSRMDGTDVKEWQSPDDIIKPELLAVDYIGRNVYFSDSIKRSISVCKISDETLCKVNIRVNN